jgi:hypothetical protein
LGHGIFTEGESWDELRANVLEAVSLHFEDTTRPPTGADALRQGRVDPHPHYYGSAAQSAGDRHEFTESSPTSL